MRRNRIRPTDTNLKRFAHSQLATARAKITERSTYAAHHSSVLEDLEGDLRCKFMEFVESYVHKRVPKKRSLLDNGLHDDIAQSKFAIHPERYVHNFSNVDLDKTTLEILSLGPSFCCPHSRDNRLAVEVQFENLYGQTVQLQPTSTENLEQLKSDLVNCCYKYRKASVNHYTPVTRAHIEALKRLKANRDILLTRPDKGAGIVIINKADYIDKMQTILQDEQKFLKTPSENDRTSMIESKLTDCLKRLHQQNLITNELFTRLKPTGSNIPRMYGLPKVQHK